MRVLLSLTALTGRGKPLADSRPKNLAGFPLLRCVRIDLSWRPLQFPPLQTSCPRLQEHQFCTLTGHETEKCHLAPMELCSPRTLTFSAQGREILPYRCRESRSRGEEAPIPKATYTRCKHSSTPHVHTLQTFKHSTPIPKTTLLNSSGRHEEKQKVAITETKKRCTSGVNTRAPRHCGGFLSRWL